METSPVNSFSVCLFLILWFTNSVESLNSSCPEPETTCGNLIVRFPFRVIGHQAAHCGYPGFDLQCTPANKAVLELPGSINLNVKHIDYKSQTIHLYDPSGCLFRHVPHLTLLTSPFQFTTWNSYLKNYTFFNCSYPRDYGGLYSTCLRSSSYHVYAVESDSNLGKLPLLFCSKIFNISSIPYGIIENHDDTLQLMWSYPMCKICESNGTRCGFNNSDTSYNTIACFDVHHKGILFFISCTSSTFSI